MNAQRPSQGWKPKLDIWKQEGHWFYCEREDLERAIKESGVTDEHIRLHMGRGYHLLHDALGGTRLDFFQVNHVEWGLTPNAGTLLTWA